MKKGLELSTFGGGCFWCTEAIFRRLKGVESVESGYSGGNVYDEKDLSYEKIFTGTTSYAESIQVKFNPKIITYEKLIEVFFYTHNPTTLNRQGNDVGKQYRSIIFFHNQKQKEISEKVKKGIKKNKEYKNPVVTEIKPFVKFFKAEKYHQDYYEKNRGNSYCSIVIDPKIKKLLKEYADNVKEEYRN